MRTEFQDWPVRTGFFLYGALSHLLMFRLYVEWSFGPGANREVADHALTNMAVTLLGGAFVLLLMPGPLLRAVRKPSPRIAVILKAAGLGALVTFIVVQALFVLGSLFWTLKVRATGLPGVGAVSLWDQFLVWLLDVETYGADMVFWSVPFAACSGVLCAACIVWLKKRLQAA